MKPCIGTVSKVTNNAIYIRPIRGGVIEAPYSKGFKRGDKIEYVVNGAKNSIMAVRLRNKAPFTTRTYELLCYILRFNKQKKPVKEDVYETDHVPVWPVNWPPV